MTKTRLIAERTWTLYEEGEEYGTCEADSVDDALDIAESNVDRANYDGEGALFVHVEVRAPEDEDYYEELGSRTVVLDAEEPECSARSHDWQSPYEILGGLEENPGVHGNGGGVIVTECCMRCGCARVTDSWAQNPETGEQGYTTVEYEEGRYAAEVAKILAAEILEPIEDILERASWVRSYRRDGSRLQVIPVRDVDEDTLDRALRMTIGVRANVEIYRGTIEIP